jgi:hypothetical protein
MDMSPIDEPVPAAETDVDPTAAARQVLAEKIARRDGLEGGLAGTQLARERSWTLRSEAERAVDAAQADLEAAKVATRYETARCLALSLPLPDQAAIRAARDRLQDAQDQLEVVIGTIEQLKADEKAYEESLWSARSTVERAAKAVASHAAEAVLSSVIQQINTLKRDWMALRFIVKNGLLPPGHLAMHAMSILRTGPGLLLLDEIPPHYINPPQNVGDEPWREALAALERDANAPLPVVSQLQP